MIGHVAPEAAVGGPIALVEEGDTIVVDVDAKELNLEVDEATCSPSGAPAGPRPAPLLRDGRAGQVRGARVAASEGAITSGAPLRRALAARADAHAAPERAGPMTLRISFKTSPQRRRLGDARRHVAARRGCPQRRPPRSTAPG